MNSYGKNFRITVFGESHGNLIGVVIDGVPAGLELSVDDIQIELDKRSPGNSEISTSRVEKDKVEISSGLFDGRSSGAPIVMVIKNENIDSSAYEKIKNTPRPGHADYTAWVKYQGFNDFRGGGQFSGRMTAALVMAGAIAKKILKTLGIEIVAHTNQIGSIKLDPETKNRIMKNFYDIAEKRWENQIRCLEPTLAERMEKLILDTKSENDSIGGIIECLVFGVPPGIGEPFFDSIESELSKLIFSIPGVKGIEFGSGFRCAEMKGSEHNDHFNVVDGKIVTGTNNAGGILGGISNGMPIVFRSAIKPTSSIAKIQQSVNLKTMETQEIQTEGAHDPCIVPRAVPVIEACTGIVLADMILRANKEFKFKQGD